MKVRAKFTVESKTELPSGYEVKLHPVTCGGAENEEFFKWTPSGELRMGLVSDDVAKGFEVGKDYYVDFTKAPEEG